MITTDDLREHVNTGLSDEALQRLLDAADERIVAYAGPPGARTEIVGGGHNFISTQRPIATVTSITELATDNGTAVTLAADDYLIRTGEMILERLAAGTNSRSHWDGRVTITYTPVDDTATREMCQIDLCKLAISYSPLLTAETIGDYSIQYAANSAWNSGSEADAILARLDVGLGMIVV